MAYVRDCNEVGSIFNESYHVGIVEDYVWDI